MHNNSTFPNLNYTNLIKIKNALIIPIVTTLLSLTLINKPVHAAVGDTNGISDTTMESILNPQSKDQKTCKANLEKITEKKLEKADKVAQLLQKRFKKNIGLSLQFDIFPFEDSESKRGTNENITIITAIRFYNPTVITEKQQQQILKTIVSLQKEITDITGDVKVDVKSDIELQNETYVLVYTDSGYNNDQICSPLPAEVN